MKKISLLGSTGSIGTSTLQVVRHLPADTAEIVALAAHSNIDLLEQQAREFRPAIVAVFNTEKAAELQARLPGQYVVAGMDGLLEAATLASANMVVSAMNGTMGLRPTVAAINAGKDIALANKETLVSAGALVMALVKEKGVRLLPIDSEHGALFQCLRKEDPRDVRRLILTASGGPFRHYTPDQLGNITPAQALAHPTWRMGVKITVDSATLMNKGLEVIEAHYLFGVPIAQIDVVIHPQSIIHSMVELVDGSILAQMSQPDMRLPIQYALTYPQREEGMLPPFDFTKVASLEFFPPDTSRFPCLRLAQDAIRIGGTMPGYMNAANEVLVGRFIKEEISWPDIAGKLEALMSRHDPESALDLDTVLHVDVHARRQAQEA